MRKLFYLLIFSLILLGFNYRKEITEYILLNFVYKNDFNYVNISEYKKVNNFYFQDTSNYLPNNEDDILNIIYTSLNNGYDEFNFYCKNDYPSCENDVEKLVSNKNILSNINNFIHPFNSYAMLNVSFNGLGKINIKVNKLYSEERINTLKEKVNQIYDELITDDMSDYQKIKTIHDYIIDNTKYDIEKAKDLDNGTNNSPYSSDTAYGVLMEGYGICSGYTDAMALFLDKMGIMNYKISSENHVWNYVYINGSWLHLDLTWDDPVINTGEERINHDYFLITTNELLDKKTGEHDFDKNIFEQKTITNS